MFENGVTQLAELRSGVNLLDREIEVAQKELETTEQYALLVELKEERATMAAKRDDTYTVLCQTAQLAFEVDGNKHPHPAITVKEFDVLIYDPDRAKSYAIDKLPNCVKLDTKAFEKVAKVLDLDFVTVSKEPKATVASDLSEWL